MKKIIFLRPAPYSDFILNNDLITSFNLNGLQLNDPVLDTDFKKTIRKIKKIKVKFNIKNIFTSPANRCKQTAELFNLPFEIKSELREIKFSVLNLTKKKDKNLDVNKLREDLVKSIVENKNREKMSLLLKRIKFFCKELKNLNGNSVFISHAFLMKFTEIFLISKKNVKNNIIFLKNYNWKIKPYEFLDGFCVTIDNTGDILSIELLKNMI